MQNAECRHHRRLTTTVDQTGLRERASLRYLWRCLKTRRGRFFCGGLNPAMQADPRRIEVPPFVAPRHWPEARAAESEADLRRTRPQDIHEEVYEWKFW